jgi:hypothetical protein
MNLFSLFVLFVFFMPPAFAAREFPWNDWTDSQVCMFLCKSICLFQILIFAELLLGVLSSWFCRGADVHHCCIATALVFISWWQERICIWLSHLHSSSSTRRSERSTFLVRTGRSIFTFTSPHSIIDALVNCFITQLEQFLFVLAKCHIDHDFVLITKDISDDSSEAAYHCLPRLHC